MPVLDCAIAKESWSLALCERNGTATRLGDTRAEPTGAWQANIQKLIQLKQLEDDWDGLGAIAPTRELVESAVGLAYLLASQGVEPPQAIVAGTDGSINFGWQDASGNYTEIEIVRPFFAEVMVIESGKPAKHWTLPTE